LPPDPRPFSQKFSAAGRQVAGQCKEAGFEFDEGVEDVIGAGVHNNMHLLYLYDTRASTAMAELGSRLL
jgi:hypothetical protein